MWTPSFIFNSKYFATILTEFASFGNSPKIRHFLQHYSVLHTVFALFIYSYRSGSAIISGQSKLTITCVITVWIGIPKMAARVPISGWAVLVSDGAEWCWSVTSIWCWQYTQYPRYGVDNIHNFLDMVLTIYTISS